VEKKRIQVASLPKPTAQPFDPLRYLAKLCYLYPQYTFSQARRLPYRWVKLLISEAERREAEKRYYLLQIVAAPHSKSGENVNKLSEHFRNIMDGK
jgi:hypothetical protein